MFGLPADTVRKRFRTKTVLNNGLNPIYDQEGFVFNKVIVVEYTQLRLQAAFFKTIEAVGIWFELSDIKWLSLIKSGPTGLNRHKVVYGSVE